MNPGSHPLGCSANQEVSYDLQVSWVGGLAGWELFSAADLNTLLPPADRSWFCLLRSYLKPQLHRGSGRPDLWEEQEEPWKSLISRVPGRRWRRSVELSGASCLLLRLQTLTAVCQVADGPN